MITFAPGEIAKAEEINANFNEVSRIESSEISLDSNFSATEKSVKRVGRIVMLNIRLTATLALSTGTFHRVGTVPSGYRPSETIRGTGISNYSPVYAYIETNGNIGIELSKNIVKDQSVYLIFPAYPITE